MLSYVCPYVLHSFFHDSFIFWLPALLSNTPSRKRKLTPVQTALQDKFALDFLNISSASKKAKLDTTPALQETPKTKVQSATRKVERAKVPLQSKELPASRETSKATAQSPAEKVRRAKTSPAPKKSPVLPASVNAPCQSARLRTKVVTIPGPPSSPIDLGDEKDVDPAHDSDSKAAESNPPSNDATKDFLYEEVVPNTVDKEPTSLAKDLNSDLDAPSAFTSPPLLQTEQGNVSLNLSCFLFLPYAFS